MEEAFVDNSDLQFIFLVGLKMAQKPDSVLTTLPEGTKEVIPSAVALKKGQKRRRTRSHNR